MMHQSHSNQPNHDTKMMWWMIAGCLLLPLILLLSFGKSSGGGGGSSWAWLIFVVLFIAAHLGMFLGHGKHKDTQTDNQRTTPTNDDTDDHTTLNHQH